MGAHTSATHVLDVASAQHAQSSAPALIFTVPAHPCNFIPYPQAVKKELVQGWKERKEAAMRAAAEAAAERARQAEERKRIELEERQHFNKLKLEFHRQAKVR